MQSILVVKGLPSRVAICVLVAAALAACTVNVGTPDQTQTQTAVPPTSVSATTPPTWEQVEQTVRSGVVRLESSGCEQGSQGSGALIGDNLVLTAAHVVDHSGDVVATVGDQEYGATIIGVSREEDLALLRLESRPDGHRFDVPAADATSPAAGSELAVFGFPLGRPLGSARGHVSVAAEEIAWGDGLGIDDAVRTDAPVNPGNSGGPAVDLQGRLVGVVSAQGTVDTALGDVVAAQGIGYLIPPHRVGSNVPMWTASPDVVEPACWLPVEDPTLYAVKHVPGTLATEVARTLALHGSSINQEDYATAHSLLSEQLQRELPLDTWTAGVASSTWWDVDVVEVDGDDEQATALVRLRTEQLDEGGVESCTDWQLRYTFVPIGTGVWSIDGADNVDGSPLACDGQTEPQD